MRMCLNVFDQPVSVFAHTEEICFFLHRLDISAADRALALFRQLALCVECFTFLTVHSFIMTFIDISLIIELLKDLLDLLLMIIIGCTDELIIGNVHAVKLFPDHCGDAVNKFFRRNALGQSFFFYLLTMFVGSCLKTDIITCHSLITGNGIRQYNLINISDVRFTGCIRNCCCNVIRPLIFHTVCLLWL